MNFSYVGFRYCLACSHLSKVNLLLLPEKIRGKRKPGYENLLLIRIKKAEIIARQGFE